MKDGIMIGVFARCGYLSINKRGNQPRGRIKMTPVARVHGPGKMLETFRYLAEEYGGHVVVGKFGGWCIEFTTHDTIRRICDLLSYAECPLPERLENEVEIMLRFLGFKTRPGPSQGSRSYEGRYEAYLDMQGLKGR